MKIIYLAGLIQFTCLAFQDYFCNSISDSLVVLSTHKVLIHGGNFFTLGTMEFQSMIERHSKGRKSLTVNNSTFRRTSWGNSQRTSFSFRSFRTKSTPCWSAILRIKYTRYQSFPERWHKLTTLPRKASVLLWFFCVFWAFVGFFNKIKGKSFGLSLSSLLVNVRCVKLPIMGSKMQTCAFLVLHYKTGSQIQIGSHSGNLLQVVHSGCFSRLWLLKVNQEGRFFLEENLLFRDGPELHPFIHRILKKNQCRRLKPKNCGWADVTHTVTTKNTRVPPGSWCTVGKVQFCLSSPGCCFVQLTTDAAAGILSPCQS